MGLTALGQRMIDGVVTELGGGERSVLAKQAVSIAVRAALLAALLTLPFVLWPV